MKKIISTLAMGMIVAYAAFADMKVSLNYRNGAELFKYENKGFDGRSTDEYGNVYVDSGYDNNGSKTTLFNLSGWNAGKDNLGLQVSGDIFTIKSTLQPTTGGNNNIIWHVFDVGAKYNGFYANTGWNGDGIMNYRSKKAADDGNEEGKVFETYKLGSIFTGSDGLCANNQISFNTGRNFYALAGYNLPVTDTFSAKIQGAVMIDRTWDNPSAEQSNGNFGWTAFLNPKLLDVFDAELFIKGKRIGEAGSDKVSEFVTGAYLKPAFIPMLADSAFGGSAVILDGKLQEWNVDWRAFVKVSGDLWITYFGKFAKLVSKEGDTPYEPVDGSAVGALAGLTSFKSSQALWNMVSVRYKINDRFTGVLSVGELSDLDDGFHLGRESADGTQVFAHPHVQIYAAKNATVTAGVLAAFAGIGANEMANKDVDMLINIPVLFRVKM